MLLGLTLLGKKLGSFVQSPKTTAAIKKDHSKSVLSPPNTFFYRAPFPNHLWVTIIQRSIICPHDYA